MPGSTVRWNGPHLRWLRDGACEIEDGTGLLDLSRLRNHRHVLVGVSGGSDSMALLHLLHAAGFECEAVTVDHGLRAGSAAEADYVREACRDLDVRHQVRRWSTARPGPGLSRRAREARRTLLAGAGTTLLSGAPIVLGHTLDDQAETVRMRARRGGGTLGLSGIPPLARLANGRAVVRPLLGTSREALRGYLRRRALHWIDDPSNADRSFERVRVREGCHGIDNAAVARLARVAWRMRLALMRDVARLFDEGLTLAAPGYWRLDTASRGGHGPRDEVLVLAVRVLAAVEGGRMQLPPADAVRRAVARDAFSISRTVVRREGALFLFRRELRNLPESRSAAEGSAWDGRFSLWGSTGTVRTWNALDVKGAKGLSPWQRDVLCALPHVEGARGHGPLWAPVKRVWRLWSEIVSQSDVAIVNALERAEGRHRFGARAERLRRAYAPTS